MAISFEAFKERLQEIKNKDTQLHDSIRIMVETNPFVEDGQGIGKDWVYELITEHLYTLFIAVNEEAAIKPLIDDMDKAIKEYEENKKKNSKLFYADPRESQDSYKLRDLLDYFYYESDWGGEITVDEKEYNLSVPKDLYDYILSL